MNWISTVDVLPYNGKLVIVWDELADKADLAYRHDSDWVGCYQDDGGYSCKVSYWMPLPESPHEEKS